jgi:hypothetical protein
MKQCARKSAIASNGVTITGWFEVTADTKINKLSNFKERMHQRNAIEGTISELARRYRPQH